MYFVNVSLYLSIGYIIKQVNVKFVFVNILYKKAYLCFLHLRNCFRVITKYMKFISFFFSDMYWKKEILYYIDEKENRPEFTSVNIREEEEI